MFDYTGFFLFYTLFLPVNFKAINFLLLLTGLSFQLFAQPSASLRFDRIEGLSQSTGYSIMKDKQGFLWIATANGLNRYDGIEMKVYKPALEKKEGQMQGRVIRSEILEDEQEQIWFSTDVTVHCFNKKNDKFTTYDLPTAEKFANPLLFKDSHLWLANMSSGVFDLDIKTQKITSHPLNQKDEAGNKVQLMYNGVYDGKNKLWFASNKGLFSFDMAGNQWKGYLRDHSFYTLSFCRDTIFISEGKELHWFDIKTSGYGPVVFNDDDNTISRDLIHRVYTDKKLNTWAGDEKGNVYCKNPDKAVFNWMGNINGNVDPVTNYPVYCFFSDTSGMLWTGAYTLGLLKADVNQQSFKTSFAGNNTRGNLYVNTIYEDENDRVWLGTFEKGIVIMDKKTGNFSDLKLPYTGPRIPYGNSVQLIQHDNKGNLWTSISGNLFVREKGKTDFVSIKIPTPSNALQVPQMWSLSEYKNGWLVGTTVGLYYVFKKNDNYSVQHLSRFGLQRIFSVWMADNNDIWIAFESGGLLIVKNIEKINEAKRLFTETNVRSFLHDEKHQLLWISTSDGLIAYHLPTGKYKSITEMDGLLNSYVFGALPGNNELWVSTNYGLSQISLSFQKKEFLPDVHVTNFTSGNGLPDNVFNARAFYKGSSGNFYFGTGKGVAWFKPGEIKPVKHIPAIQMISLLVNEKNSDSTLSPGYITKLSLSYNENNLYLRFRGIEFNDPLNVTYAYRLKGWDKDWVYSRRLNEVRYNNLPDGKYTFNIKAADGSGAWNDNIYSVSIVIHAPFWKTWWFYSLVVIVVTGFVVWLTRNITQRKLKMKVLELEKQKELEKERQRISREMHDDIGAGLTQITLMSESAKKYGKDQKEEQLEEIANTSRKLVGNMSEIIWSLHPEYKTLDHLIIYMREQLYKMLEYSGKEYIIRLPDEGKEIVLSNQQRRNILLITKEIVNNIIKHSKANNISVLGQLYGRQLSVKISDDGEGFDMQKKYSGNGLKNIKHRIDELNGQLKVDSSAGNGAVFSFVIPV